MILLKNSRENKRVGFYLPRKGNLRIVEACKTFALRVCLYYSSREFEETFYRTCGN